LDRGRAFVKTELWPFGRSGYGRHPMQPVVVWRNAHLVAIDKPPGWLAVPGRPTEQDRERKDDSRPVVGRWLEKELGARVFPVHRLDEPVSGLLLFALDPHAHRALNDAFATRAVGKTYEAWTEAGPTGTDTGGPVTWRSKLCKGKRRTFEAPHGKVAETVATWLGPHTTPAGIVQAWRLLPLTGRPHQLRVHLAAAGCPILGDALYGGPAWPTARGIALRAVQIDLSNVRERAQFQLPARITVAGLGDWAAKLADATWQ
jgi:tRNA pseudouridine32 synthase/23S rRNA pseudouridine746 synthase